MQEQFSVFKKLGVAAALVHVLSAGAPQSTNATPGRPTSTAQRDVLNKYCVVCHNDRAKVGGLTLDKRDLVNLTDSAEVWEKVVRKLRAGMMPPAGMPRPDKSTIDALAGFV